MHSSWAQVAVASAPNVAKRMATKSPSTLGAADKEAKEDAARENELGSFWQGAQAATSEKETESDKSQIADAPVGHGAVGSSPPLVPSWFVTTTVPLRLANDTQLP